jgi:hypothetical protein
MCPKAVKALLFFLVTGALIAQTEKATLRGTVMDPSGAIVANASVVVTEVTTNVEARRVATDDNGNYEIPELRPAVYRIEVDVAGFRKFIADTVVLDPGQFRRFDVRLAVGTATEAITVEAGAALIQTEGGTISGLIDAKMRYPDVPTVDVYPSPLAMLVTTPSIQGNGWNLVMAGIADRNKQTWALDGVANDTTADQNDNPNFFETVEVTTQNSTTDSARAASFNLISKRGANAFHGSAYWKEENAAFNTRPFFDPRRTPYILHEGEVEQGGRILKDRTFFFFGWMYQNIPLGSYLQASVPTPLMRAGDFSQFLDLSLVSKATIVKDPYNGTPFPNNQIPQNRFSPVSQSIMSKYYPLPNQSWNTFTNNYGWLHPFNQELYKGNWPFIRVDHKVTDKNHLYVRYMVRKTPYVWTQGVGELFDSTQTRDHRSTVASDTHIFSSNLVNSFTFGHTTDLLTQGAPDKGVTPFFGDDVVKTLGIQGVNLPGLHTVGFPPIAITGLTSLSIRNDGGATNFVTTDDGINTFEDTLTWMKGKHVLKFGAEYRHFWRLLGTVSSTTYGNFTFNGTFTSQAFADFLLGIPQNSQRLTPLVNRTVNQNQSGLFFNDTFKLTSKLTLDYGVRWDYYATPLYDDGLMWNWDQASGNVIVAPGTRSKVSPLYPSNIGVVEGNVIPSAKRTNIRPRISLAYRVSDKLVIRGGYAEFTESWGYLNSGRVNGAGPFQLTESYNNQIVNGAPLFTFPNPFPGSLSAASVPGQSVTAFPMKTDEGVLRQYNATVERQMGGLGVRLSLLGLRAGGQNYTLNIDKPPASTIKWTASRNPYPQFTSASVIRNDGSWHRDALQFAVTKRAGAFTFDSNFTWANNISNYYKLQDPYNPLQWGTDGNERRLQWVTNATWAVPVGKGRRFLDHAPALVNGVVGGWGVQAITEFASGQHYNPSFSGSDPSNTNTSGGMPDCVGNPWSGTQTLNQYYNVAAFAVPQNGTYGNCGWNVLKGYPIHVGHMSVAKTFAITERIKTTFTAQISNVTNTQHFNNPNANISAVNFAMFTSIVANYNPEKQGYRQIDFKLRLNW